MLTLIPNCRFIDNLAITAPIDDSHFLNKSNLFLNKHGFELSPLEQIYYSTNNVPISKGNLKNPFGACNFNWFKNYSTNKNFYIEHSWCFTRLEYQGEARDQIIQFSKQHPQLADLLDIKPKWAIDFRLDYLDKEMMIEVLHLEEDFYDIEQAREMKDWVEAKILSTDWVDFVARLKAHLPTWQSIKGETLQRQWKAEFWGLPKEHAIKQFCFD
jgi:hypothetical protein